MTIFFRDSNRRSGTPHWRRGRRSVSAIRRQPTSLSPGSRRSPGHSGCQYRMKSRDSLVEKTKAAADKVRRWGDVVELEPMNAYERRIVHNTLKDDPSIETHSVKLMAPQKPFSCVPSTDPNSGPSALKDPVLLALEIGVYFQSTKRKALRLKSQQRVANPWSRAYPSHR